MLLDDRRRCKTEVVSDGAAWSNKGEILQSFACIASDCMMWRWDITREEAQNGYLAKNGHCGLAERRMI
jgi:hypothetical protein